MKIDLFSPEGCGIKKDKRLKKVIIKAENVKEQEALYQLMENISFSPLPEEKEK